MSQSFLNGRVTLHPGDCMAVLDSLPDCSVDSVVCDPPYHLTSIVKRFGAENAAPAQSKQTGAFARASRGFMGKQWDGGDIAFNAELWAKVLRVLKPGGHLVAFSGTRTYHRMAVAIEDAGFEIRDQIAWTYGAGFPKSHNTSRALNEHRCRCEAVAGGSEAECDLHSVRCRNVSSPLDFSEGCREVLLAGLPEQSAPRPVPRPEPSKGSEGREEFSLEGRGDVPQEAWELRVRAVRPLSSGSGEHGEGGRICDGTSPRDGTVDGTCADADRGRAPSGPRSAEQCAEQSGTVAGQPEPQARGAWPLCGQCGKPMVPDGLGTALKPAFEPICLARKPLIGTVAENVLAHGTGAINVDGCRVAVDPAVDDPRLGGKGDWSSDKMAKHVYDGGYAGVRVGSSALGRFPANLVHDGSPEVVACFPSEAGAAAPASGSTLRGGNTSVARGRFNGLPDGVEPAFHADLGSAARFFYSAKADADDRLGSKHPTVKPVDLMRWLVRLVTPKGGTVLDPFAGTGTTGAAAYLEGMSAVLIEREAEYQADIARRMDLMLAGPDEKARKLAVPAALDDLPLFNISPA